MHVADGGLPQYIPSCHFPNSLCITLPLWSTTVPSTSFILEFQYFACKAHTKKQRHHFLSPISLRSTPWSAIAFVFMQQRVKQLYYTFLKTDNIQYVGFCSPVDATAETSVSQWQNSFRLRLHAHKPLPELLLHMVHKIRNTSGVMCLVST